MRQGVCGNSQCCTLQQDEVSVPSPVRMASESSNSDVDLHRTVEYTFVYPYQPQSEEVIVDETKHEATEDSKITTHFLEHKMTSVSEVPTISYLHPTTEYTAIQKFFSRPVRIDTKIWNESDPIGADLALYPWYAWASNAAVANKLNNYAFFRGDLHLKFQISASPFYYGMMQASYLPLTAFKGDTIIVDSFNNYMIARSQRPKVEIDPSLGDTFEMVLPFIYNYNMLNVQSQGDFIRMGVVYWDIYSALQSANGVSGNGVVISTYAWVDNIILMGASAGYAAQSDEYGEGPVSRPASWLSKFASNFTNIPIIGPFAMATQIGAAAVSSIASIFGFTNVPVIDDTLPMRSEAFPKLASSEIGFPVEKLTLDPKNELSVDPRIAGLDSGVDELAISTLVQRPSYLARSTWTSADTVDTIKFTSRITPVLCANSVYGSQIEVYSVPMAYFSNLFQYWRGDIIFTFKVICSKYHKGKLRISFDPNGNNLAGQNITNTANTHNTVATTIWDIGETNLCEIRIPYQQARQFLKIDSFGSVNWTTSTTPTFTRQQEYDNGMITIRVQNVLTSPTAVSTVDILIYARGAENLEFASPDNVDDTGKFSFFQPQSYEYNTVHANQVVDIGAVEQDISSQYITHFGENIKSLRQLIRRYSKHESLLMGNGGVPASSFSYWYARFMRLPTTPGFQSGALSNANKIVGTGSAPYHFVHFTPLSWVANAFLCYRGSVNRTFNLNGYSSIGSFRCYRTGAGYTAAILNARNDYPIASNGTLSRASMYNSGSVGQALTDQRTQAGINVQFPMFSNSIFQSTDPAFTVAGNAIDGSDNDSLTVVVESSYPSNNVFSQILNCYVAAGTDFSLHFFLNTPSVWIQSTFPTAA